MKTKAYWAKRSLLFKRWIALSTEYSGAHICWAPDRINLYPEDKYYGNEFHSVIDLSNNWAQIFILT